jgi:hypothetical protein
MPSVTGWGMKQFQLVVFNALFIVGKVTSEEYAESHLLWTWIVSGILDLVLFSVVAIPIWLLTRKRFARVGIALLICWTVFYLATLFVLFPATDGP